MPSKRRADRRFSRGNVFWGVSLRGHGRGAPEWLGAHARILGPRNPRMETSGVHWFGVSFGFGCIPSEQADGTSGHFLVVRSRVVFSGYPF